MYAATTILTMSTPPHPPLRVERRGNAQFIVLDRPRARNALTSDVIERLHRAYAAGEDNATLCAHVILGANSGTFCAGGDVRAVREMVLKNERDAAGGRPPWGGGTAVESGATPRATLERGSSTRVGRGSECASSGRDVRFRLGQSRAEGRQTGVFLVSRRGRAPGRWTDDRKRLR